MGNSGSAPAAAPAQTRGGVASVERASPVIVSGGGGATQNDLFNSLKADHTVQSRKASVQRQEAQHRRVSDQRRAIAENSWNEGGDDAEAERFIASPQRRLRVINESTNQVYVKEQPVVSAKLKDHVKCRRPGVGFSTTDSIGVTWEARSVGQARFVEKYELQCKQRKTGPGADDSDSSDSDEDFSAYGLASHSAHGAVNAADIIKFHCVPPTLEEQVMDAQGRWCRNYAYQGRCAAGANCPNAHSHHCYAQGCNAAHGSFQHP